MKKTLLVATLGAALLSPSLALAADDLADKYFTGKNPTLTPQERAAIDIAKRWNAGAATGMKPVAGSNGAIKFLFGAQLRLTGPVGQFQEGILLPTIGLFFGVNFGPRMRMR